MTEKIVMVENSVVTYEQIVIIEKDCNNWKDFNDDRKGLW